MPDSSSVGQRFSQLIQQLGMSKNAFAISLDKTATVIQHLVDERNKPGFDLMRKVFEVYPNVSKDWLLMGEGPMLLESVAFPTVAEPATQSAPNTPVQLRVAPSSPNFPEALFTVSAARQPTAIVSPPVEPTAATAPADIAGMPPAASEPMAAPGVAAAPPEPVLSVPAPAATAAPPAASDAAYLTAALHAQYLQHQLALAEQRNQHLLAQQHLMQQQQTLMQQMLDAMRRPV